jgi:hypothetical protein
VPYVVGGRSGWRLPTLEELLTLFDPTVPFIPYHPRLPSGHPFNVPIGLTSDWGFWTTAHFQDDSQGIVHHNVYFFSFYLENGIEWYDKAVGENFVWCVRGGQGISPQQ